MVTDIILAYLALGSPVGVYLLLRGERSGSILSNIAKPVVGLGLWPIFLVVLVYRRKPVSPSASVFDTRNTTDARITYAASLMRSAVEDSLETSDERRFAFRKELFDAIDRFVGLRLASYENIQPQRTSSEVFTVSGHPKPGLASLCLARRNARKIATHALRSSDDLRETLRLRAPDIAKSELFEELFATEMEVELPQATGVHESVIISGS